MVQTTQQNFHVDCEVWSRGPRAAGATLALSPLVFERREIGLLFRGLGANGARNRKGSTRGSGSTAVTGGGGWEMPSVACILLHHRQWCVVCAPVRNTLSFNATRMVNAISGPRKPRSEKRATGRTASQPAFYLSD